MPGFSYVARGQVDIADTDIAYMQAQVNTPWSNPYEQLEHTSHLMVLAAHRADWPEVLRLETMAAAQVAALQAPTVAMRPTLAQRKARHQALLAILRHDDQVRALANPELHRQYAAMRFPAVKSAAPLPIDTGNP